MNILQIHKYYWPRDGASNYMLQLSERLQAAGHTVVPFALQEPETLPTPFAPYFVSPMALADPKKLSWAQKIQAAAHLFYNPEAVRQLRALLQNHQFEVAHIHNIYHHLSPAILPVLKRAGIKIVMTVHDYHLISPNYSLFHHGQIHEEDARGWYWSCVKNKCVKNSRAYSALKVLEMIWQFKIKKYFARNVDVFITPSQFMADMLIKHGYEAAKIFVVPNPVEVISVNKNGAKTSYVGFAGRLSEEKGIEVLVRAAEQLPQIAFKIAGSGPEEARLREFIQTKQLTNVELVGFKTGQALQDFYAGARLLVVPSIWYENGPLSVLEPMARGQIVLGSNIGGIPEMLPAEYLFAAGDVNGLAKQVEHWWNASETARQTAGRKLQTQVARFDPIKHTEKIVTIYESLVA